MSATASEQDPRSVVEAFFAPEGIPDKSSAYTGEMLRHLGDVTLGQHFGPGATKIYRPLSSAKNTAVYSVTVRANRTTQNWYIFVRKSNEAWRIEAVRTLAQTGLVAQLAEALRQKQGRSIDEEWKLNNAELILSSDEDLKRYLTQNLAKFKTLVGLIRDRNIDPAMTMVKELFLTSAQPARTGCIELLIGGVLDNTVGYLFVPDGVEPPAMQPDDVIYLERVMEHWYVFKTT